ncbi:hypothetical protein MED92_11474 [Oceanospirillum sp. MED92]|uniref:Uncharacterized protein n=2 Tax=Neptuniibacter caesariensis TaxID=207954 RepID=A0A7U8C6X5_NEPCE|nr:hypothetical protein MED92_11474 [Oceanospirillum sp. MED92] [Neptuniibacter caesariensis]
MYEMLVGLEVTDDQIYQSYREAMRPILEFYGGEFGYDFRVSEVLKNIRRRYKPCVHHSLSIGERAGVILCRY